MLEVGLKTNTYQTRRGVIRNSEFSPEDFEPASKDKVLHELTRPSLSYWQDAWIRFRKNKQALMSFALVIALVLFVTVGPLLWKVDPAAQDAHLASTPPTLGAYATVMGELDEFEEKVLEDFPESPEEAIAVGAPQNFRTIIEPSTQAVRLEWDPVEGATGYSLYRNEVEPGRDNLGIPLGDVMGGNVVTYEDTATLQAQNYFYSIVAKNLDDEEGADFSKLKIDVLQAISVEDAQKYKEGAVEGDHLKLRSAPAGIDELGRDILARLMSGGRVSLFIGFVASFCYVLLGVIIGGIAGYYGGQVDNWIMRFTDFVTGLPFLLFMILLKVVMSVGPGESGIGALLIALIVLSWTGAARLVRGQVLQLRESDFVAAAKLLGASPTYLLFRHLIPNLLGVILVAVTFGIPAAIFSEAFLSFIGLGVAAPATSWGAMCTDGVSTLLNHPHEFFLPAFLISLTVLAFNLLGDGLRDALDPKLRSVE